MTTQNQDQISNNNVVEGSVGGFANSTTPSVSVESSTTSQDTTQKPTENTTQEMAELLSEDPFDGFKEGEIASIEELATKAKVSTGEERPDFLSFLKIADGDSANMIFITHNPLHLTVHQRYNPLAFGGSGEYLNYLTCPKRGCPACIDPDEKVSKTREVYIFKVIHVDNVDIVVKDNVESRVPKPRVKFLSITPRVLKAFQTKIQFLNSMKFNDADKVNDLSPDERGKILLEHKFYYTRAGTSFETTYSLEHMAFSPNESIATYVTKEDIQALTFKKFFSVNLEYLAGKFPAPEKKPTGNSSSQVGAYPTTQGNSAVNLFSPGE